MRPPYRHLGDRARDPATGRTVPRTDLVVCGRKFCVGCGRWRLLVDYGRTRRAEHPYRVEPEDGPADGGAR